MLMKLLQIIAVELLGGEGWGGKGFEILVSQPHGLNVIYHGK